jgi:hypothetical protein
VGIWRIIMGIDFPWYVITGEINLDNFTKLITVDRGFIWRVGGGGSRGIHSLGSAVSGDFLGIQGLNKEGMKTNASR